MNLKIKREILRGVFSDEESEGRMLKANYFSGSEENILHIHGDKDNAVPRESLNVDF